MFTTLLTVQFFSLLFTSFWVMSSTKHIYTKFYFEYPLSGSISWTAHGEINGLLSSSQNLLPSLPYSFYEFQKTSLVSQARNLMNLPSRCLIPVLVFKWFLALSNSSLLLLLSRFSHVRLCDPIDGSPPGSPVPGILQARTLEWVAISFSNAGKWKVKVKSVSHVRVLTIPWTAAHQAPPSMGFSRQEYWSGVPLPSLIELFATASESVTIVVLLQ